MMKNALIVVICSAALASCGHSRSANQQAEAPPQPKKPPAFCFFKDAEMKDWTAKRDKDGNIALSGKAHVKDSRYKAVFGPPAITSNQIDIAPTLTLNSGYEAPDDWWDLSLTIPNSRAITNVRIGCGAHQAAALALPPQS